MTQGAIAMRIYARKTLASALGVGIDDYLIVAASLIIAYVQIAGTVGKPYHILTSSFKMPTSSSSPQLRPVTLR